MVLAASRPTSPFLERCSNKSCMSHTLKTTDQRSDSGWEEVPKDNPEWISCSKSNPPTNQPHKQGNLVLPAQNDERKEN